MRVGPASGSADPEFTQNGLCPLSALWEKIKKNTLGGLGGNFPQEAGEKKEIETTRK